MKVFKFGGASIAEPGRMAALLPIIIEQGQPLVLVLSALGKTTNALEAIVTRAGNNDIEAAIALAREVALQHLAYARVILNKNSYAVAEAGLMVHFRALEGAIYSFADAGYDKGYDQIVSIGELLSSLIFAFFLEQNNIDSVWVDARNIIRTDDTYRDAVIDWDYSAKKAQEVIGGHISKGATVITQGFIGATEQGKSVTLGREGSDYTAAVLAAMLHLESVTIWKDVNGFRNADPKLFPNTVKIDALSYNEVIEMAYYGAQIIHPKTIKPLQNNNIPLYVKCFLDRTLEGSVIKADVCSACYPPLIVWKDNQELVQVTTRDFSFITEENLSKLYRIFHGLKIKINLIQNAAISFIACIDNRPDKVKELIAELDKDYKVATNEKVTLLTVRHFTPEIVFELTKDRHTLLKQETRRTVQVVMK